MLVYKEYPEINSHLIINMFIVQTQSEVNISDIVKLSVDDFRILEPNLENLPDGYDSRIYYPCKIHEIYGKDKITVKRELDWIDGNRYISRLEDFKVLYYNILKKDEESSKNLSAELEKTLDYKQRRLLKYPKIDQMVIEMWEHLIEKKNINDTDIPFIIEKRNQVRKQIPKDKKTK